MQAYQVAFLGVVGTIYQGFPDMCQIGSGSKQKLKCMHESYEHSI